MEEVNESTIKAALNVYAALKRGQKKYRQAHMKEHCELNRRAYYRLKEDPERYAAYLEGRKLYQRERNARKKAEAEAQSQQTIPDTPENLGDSTKN